MVVTAAFISGGNTLTTVVTSYIYPTTALTADVTSVTISYTYDSVTKTANQAVTISSVPAVSDATWAQISEISQAGTGDTYWDIGDTKTITLNGTVGTLSLSNLSLNVFILDFNHPINGSTADNNIIWGGFKTTGGVDVALCDSGYGSNYSDGTKYFNMNHWGGSSSPYNTNYGGWKGCDLRYDILGGTKTAPSGYGSTPTTSRVGYDATAATISSPVSNTLMSALPSDFRNVLRLHTHYVDNKGNKSNTDANVTSCVDAIFLLSEFEVHGARTYANTYEQSHQKQMSYYAAGNSKIKYRHDATGTAVLWWCSSANYNNANNFCNVNTSGAANNNNSRNSRGLAPDFIISGRDKVTDVKI